MATAWPWPYPQAYAQAEQYLPKLTVPMNRADPFFERDATGWQFININNGHTDMRFTLYNNKDRSVRFDPSAGKPQDAQYQEEDARTSPQIHY